MGACNDLTPSLKELVVITLVAVAAFLASYAVQDTYEHPPRPFNLGPFQPALTGITDDEGNYKYGRYLQPFEGEVSFGEGEGTDLERFVGLKKWVYHSFSSGHYYISLAIVDLNYAAHCFVYVVDKRDNFRLEYNVVTPLAQGVTFAKGPRQGETKFVIDEERGRVVRTWWDDRAQVTRVQADLQMTQVGVEDPTPVDISFYVAVKAQQDELALLYPIKLDQPAFTNKIAGAGVNGVMSVGVKAFPFHGVGVSDWTYSMAERITEWRWASCGTIATDKNTVVGINLSQKVYDDAVGMSMENAVWVNGTLHVVGVVEIKVPAAGKEATEDWIISSTGTMDNVNVQLRFTPRGAREEHLNLGLIKSDFVQPYGTFSGTINVGSLGPDPIVIEDAYGVVENHYAKW